MACPATMTSRQRALLAFSLRDFDARWDEEALLLRSDWEGKQYHGTRESAYYALALLERDAPGDRERAARIIGRLNALQYLHRGQPWHGTFPSAMESPVPPETVLNGRRMDREEAYALDVLLERLFVRFRRDMAEGGASDAAAKNAADTLRSSLRRVWPAVWDTYDPNWREFILCTYALMLRFYEDRLPAETAAGMDRAAREGVAAALERAESGVTPLNSNVWIVHVLMCELFAERWENGDLLDHAEKTAAALTEEYLSDGAVAEFNSPTYNGVILTYTPFLRECAGEKARTLGKTLDEGLWADVADFYSPALKNICGPYSRGYEMDLRVHTAVPMLMYLDPFLVPEEELPPFSVETESTCILCLSDRRIPDAVRPLLSGAREEREVRRTFRELCERGAPGEERTLCTATARIGDRLMYGCMSGSRNTSYQLNAASAFWRNPRGGVSTFRLLRMDRDMRLVHLRTVFFDFAAEKGKMRGTVSNRTGDRVWLAFEFESPDAPDLCVSEESWTADGLIIGAGFSVETSSGDVRKAAFVPSAEGEHIRRLLLCLEEGETLRAEMALSLA